MSAPHPVQVGPYRLTEQLGRGGMGIVYRATDPTGTDVAVKLLVNTTGNAIKRFSREAHALRKVRHPSVVPLLDMGVHEGRPYLVTEYVSGESLEALIAREGPVPSRNAARWVCDLAQALTEIHAQGLLHRDVKPANVLVDRAGDVRLTDFGLVKLVSEGFEQLSRTGQLLGTPGYWAPEQVRGEIHDMGPFTDVYGLGATLYACLTGLPPHRAGTLMELLGKGFDVLPPSRHVPELGPHLDAICLRALEERRERRYPDPAALAADLQRYLAGEGLPRRRRRRVLPALALTGLALTVGAGFAIAARSAQQPAPSVASASPPPPAGISPPPDSDVPLLDDESWRIPPPQGGGDPALVTIPTPRPLAELDALLSETTDAPERARLHAERGRARAEQRDLEGALADFTEALHLDPDDFAALIGRALVHMARSDASAALLDLARARQQHPDHPEIYRLRSQLHELSGDVEAAADDLERLLALDPDDAEAWSRLGIRRGQQDRSLAALRAFDRALELEPDQPVALLNRSLAHRDLHQYSLGLRDAKRALELEPEDKIRAALAQLYLRVADYDAVLADEALIHPENDFAAIGHQLRGRAFLELGDSERSLDEYDLAVELQPSPDHLRLRAQARLQQGDVPGAREDLLASFRKETFAYTAIWLRCLGEADLPLEGVSTEHWPGPIVRYLRGQLPRQSLLRAARSIRDGDQRRKARSEVHAVLGFEAQARGARREARQHLLTAVALGPPTGDFLHEARRRLPALAHDPDPLDEVTPLPVLRARQNELGESGAWVRSLVVFDSILARAPTAEDHYWRSSLLGQLGRFDESLPEIDAALALTPTAECWRLRSNMQLLAGDPQAAVQSMLKALELERTPGLLDELGARYQSLSRYDESLEAYDAALELQPDYATSLAGRGVTLSALGREQEALQDLNAAKRTLRNDPKLLVARAHAYWKLGQAADAHADLKSALRLDPLYTYAALWLAGFGGDPTRARELAGVRNDWEGALLNLILEVRTLDEVLSQAESSPWESSRRERRCETYCFAGLLAERAGDAERATELYRAVLETGVTNFSEFTWAQNRLKTQLQPHPW